MKYPFLLFVSILFASHVFAQTGSDVEAEMIVSATRSEQPDVRIPAGIVVISREEILASGASHVADVLRGSGGIQLSDLYGDGSRATVSMRGFGDTANANTLVLVDGRRLNNPDIGNPDVNSVAIKDIERIEIIQGSGGVLFGDQAVGGVINIITRQPGAFDADVSVTAGDYRRRQLSASVGQGFDNGFSYLVSAEAREADNYRRHNQAEYSNLFARGGFDYGSGRLFVEAQAVSDKLQTPGALLADEVRADRRQSLPEYENDYSDIDSRILRFGIEQTLSDHWRLLADFTDRDAEGEFVLSFRGMPAAGVPNRQDRGLQSINPRLIGRYDLDNGPLVLTFGADYEQSDYFLESQFGTQQNEQTVKSAYAQLVTPLWASVDLALGARHAKVENALIDRPAFGDGVPDDADLDDTITIGSVGLNVRASDTLRHFIRYEENYRFAKVDEHTQSPVVPDFFTGESGESLKTQTGQSTEVGVEWTDAGHFVSATLFRLNLENEIMFDPLSFQNVNVKRTRRDGLMLSSGHPLTETLRLGLNYGYLDTEIRSGAFAGNRVPFVAEHTAGIDLNYTMSDAWRIFAGLHYIDDRLFTGDFANELPPLEGYTVLNAQLSYHSGNWQVSLRINNLFDKAYSDAGSAVDLFDPDTFESTTVGSFYPAPRRNAVAKMEYHF